MRAEPVDQQERVALPALAHEPRAAAAVSRDVRFDDPRIDRFVPPSNANETVRCGSRLVPHFMN